MSSKGLQEQKSKWQKQNKLIHGQAGLESQRIIDLWLWETITIFGIRAVIPKTELFVYRLYLVMGYTWTLEQWRGVLFSADGLGAQYCWGWSDGAGRKASAVHALA